MIGYPPFFSLVTVNWSLTINSSPSDTTPCFVPGAGIMAAPLALMSNALTAIVSDDDDARAEVSVAAVEDDPLAPRATTPRIRAAVHPELANPVGISLLWATISYAPLGRPLGRFQTVSDGQCPYGRGQEPSDARE